MGKISNRRSITGYNMVKYTLTVSFLYTLMKETENQQHQNVISHLWTVGSDYAVKIPSVNVLTFNDVSVNNIS
jgi:hypothetical protein